MAIVGAGPSRMRGVCCANATARNGDAGNSHSAHVSFAARKRLSQPSGVPFTSGVPDSM